MITATRGSRELEQRLVEAEATIQALLSGQIDAVVDSKSKTPVLLAKAQNALRDSEERFRQLASNTSEVFFIMDAKYSETLYINAAYEKVWGVSCESLYDDPHSFLASVLPEDRPIVVADVARALSGGPTENAEFRVVHPNGDVRWVLARTSAIKNERGQVYRIGGIATDVTERHNALRALEESVARFQRLTEASFDAIDITQDGIILEINAGFLRTFGYERENEVVGRAVVEFCAEESRAEVTRRMIEGIDGSYDVLGLRKDGSKVFLEATARGTTIGGRPARITALRDITERRLLEEQFRQAQKMEAVGRLAGGVAHDFNNLLMIITGYSDLLLQSLMASDPRRQDVEQIRKAADAAASLTRQLLAFSRQQVIEPTIVVLEDVVSSASAMLRRVIGEDVALVTEFSESKSTVYIDASQLEQVIMNLVVNARDAMPTGGTLTIATASVELTEKDTRAHAVPPGQFALLAVTDTGVGMSKETHARIFEPFFTTKDQGKGTGLGLATVYGIVKQGGGYLDVRSEPGRGATFNVYLPIVDDDAEACPPIVEPETPRGIETILLVEDSDGVRDIAVRVLERQGYNVIVASNAKAALEVSRTFAGAIDLLVTDVVMPEMSGRVLAETIAIDRPQARLLYMSGYTDDAVVRHGVMRLETPYLQKPFSPHALASRVREVLDAAG